MFMMIAVFSETLSVMLVYAIYVSQPLMNR